MTVNYDLQNIRNTPKLPDWNYPPPIHRRANRNRQIAGLSTQETTSEESSDFSKVVSSLPTISPRDSNTAISRPMRSKGVKLRLQGLVPEAPEEDEETPAANHFRHLTLKQPGFDQIPLKKIPESSEND